MSTLFVNNLNTETGSTITVPTGKKLIVTDSASIVAPEQIIQTTQKANSAAHSNSSPGNWADTNYQHSITPVYSNSLVELTFNIPFRLNGTPTYLRGAIRIYRDISGGASTLVVNSISRFEMFQVRNASNEHDNIANFIYRDNPATTSAVTYRAQSYIHNDSGAGYFQTYDANSGGNIILKEIAQ